MKKLVEMGQVEVSPQAQKGKAKVEREHSIEDLAVVSPNNTSSVRQSIEAPSEIVQEECPSH